MLVSCCAMIYALMFVTRLMAPPRDADVYAFARCHAMPLMPCQLTPPAPLLPPRLPPARNIRAVVDAAAMPAFMPLMLC